jgi:thiamine pyrophosphate-dependent acetolactate synthase large subunit-like protein
MSEDTGTIGEAITGGEALIAALANEGVDVVFGIPGTHNLAAYAAMADHGIEHVLVSHEQGAGYAADGYARSSGRPGVVLTTTGPAILNAAASAAQAYSDSVPVLFISPGMPLRHPGLGNGLLHEIKDQSRAMDAVVSYSHRVTSLAEIPLAVAQAFAAMTSGRPRPVHVEVPLDLLEERGPAASLLTPARTIRPSAELPAVEAAAAALSAARSPLIIVGGGAADARAQTVALAEALGAPVVSTANGKGAFPPDHALFAGDGVHHPAVGAAVSEADVVVAIGTELAPSDWWAGLPAIARLVRIDIDPRAVHVNAAAAHPLVGDAAATLDLLVACLAAAFSATADCADAPQRAEELRRAHRRDAQREGETWLPLLSALERALPADAVIAGDSAMACYYGALSNLPVHRPRSFLYPTGGGTLGYGLPAGIGAKTAHPDRAVVVLHGDGGLLFSVSELATAARLRLALPVIVVDNGGFGEIRNEMADRREREHAVALGTPDLPAVARGLGCHAAHVADPADVGRHVRAALAADRPTLLHVSEDSRAARAMRAATSWPFTRDGSRSSVDKN